MTSQLRLIGASLLVLLLALGLWRLYHTGVEAGRAEVQLAWDADKIAQAEAQREALLAYASRITQAQEQHDHDQAAIDKLAADARGLRVHLPACGDAAAPGADPHGAARALSERVDASFARLQERAAGLFARCDQLNVDAIRANGQR